MPLALLLEPLEHVAVKAQMHRGFAARHHDPGAFPKFLGGVAQILTSLTQPRQAMMIIGCDLHTRYEQVAMLSTETGEIVERRLEHENGEARGFYAALPGPVRVGIEATGLVLIEFYEEVRLSKGLNSSSFVGSRPGPTIPTTEPLGALGHRDPKAPG